MKLSTPPTAILLLIFTLPSIHALLITSPLPSVATASPASALQAPSISFFSLSTSTSIATLSKPPPTTRGAETDSSKALVTAKPDFTPGDELDWSLAQEWHITTFWSCATFGKDRVFCGWHEPVRPGGDEIAAANPRRDARAAAGVAGAVAAAFAAAL